MPRLSLVLLLALALPAGCSAPPAVDDDGTSPTADCESMVGAPSFYEDNPTFTDPREDGGYWLMVEPAQAGLDAALLQQASDTLQALPYVRSFLVARGGELAWERYFGGAGPRDSGNVHSASKSLLALLVGIAVDQGYLSGVDQPLAELLPVRFAAAPDDARQGLTIERATPGWSDRPAACSDEVSGAVVQRPVGPIVP